MFNFHSLDENTGDSFPEKKIIIDVGKKQQTEKKYTEEEILAQALEFTVTQTSVYFARLMNIYNEQISNGITNLSMNDMWVNLGKVAEHAMRHKIKVLEREFKDKEGFQDIIDLAKLRHKVLKSSILEINEMFDAKWLKDNYPTLIKKEDI